MPRTPQLLRVLVADGETIMADSLALLLQTRGYKARAVYSAEGALIAARDLQPHAIIADDEVLGMSGSELANLIEQRFPDCTVILLSRNAGRTSFAAGRGDSVSRRILLRKPMSPGQIIDFLATFVPFA